VPSDAEVAPIELVLFDLGGVLIDLAGVPAMRELSGIDRDDELWRRWLTCPWVRSFERGDCTADEFATGLVDAWELDIAPSAFLDSFGGWPRGPLPGAEALVTATRAVVPVGCLSNTNELHWQRNFSRWPILDAFDVRFLSFELRMLKPDAEVFDHVAGLLPQPRNRVLFLDDNEINVDAARESGFAAVTVRGVTQTHEALVAAGVLGP
jgi:putative hydrolase of the HAD superfamily